MAELLTILVTTTLQTDETIREPECARRRSKSEET